MFGEGTRLIRLDNEHEIKPFDCGDADLNDFLANDAKLYLSQLMAVTYLVENDTDTIAFFSVLNDRIAYEDMPVLTAKRDWNRFRRIIPNNKRTGSYPCVKIGRFAVARTFHGLDYGSTLMNYIKYLFINQNKTGCRFILVDAYLTATDFYLKNQFEYLPERTNRDRTKLMYFDLKRLT